MKIELNPDWTEFLSLLIARRVKFVLVGGHNVVADPLGGARIELDEALCEMMGRMRSRLLAIYDDVERRTGATGDAQEWWPCRKGCDTCCRRLADIPRLVRAEWELLEEGLAALTPEVREVVDARIEALAVLERAGEVPRHVTCPMLDDGAGACLVYAHRPAACRTYGFYVERGIGLHCELITEAVAARDGNEEPVVWGNQEGVDHALGRLGEAPLPLTAWVARSRTR